MIFRLTHKLGKKIKVSPSLSLEPDENPYADWIANLFRAEHVQYIILTNTASLYSVVMLGRGITDGVRFVRRSLDCIHEYMIADGLEEIYHRHIAPETKTISFSKTGNRRVLGSMNDIVYDAKFSLIVHERTPFEASYQLNRMPMGMLNYKYAIEAFMALAVNKQR